MNTRRDFVRWLAAALGSPAGGRLTVAARPPAAARRSNSFGPREEGTMGATGSDVGSLFPFIRSQAVRGEFPLSFLREEFREVAAWKRYARGKLLELLQYAPPR